MQIRVQCSAHYDPTGTQLIDLGQEKRRSLNVMGMADNVASGRMTRSMLSAQWQAMEVRVRQESKHQLLVSGSQPTIATNPMPANPAAKPPTDILCLKPLARGGRTNSGPIPCVLHLFFFCSLALAKRKEMCMFTALQRLGRTACIY
jgi:hypothetical protein